MRCCQTVLLPLLLTACNSLTGERTPGVLAANLAESGPLARTLEISLDQPAALTIRYRTAGAPELKVESSTGFTHAVLLTRLRPGSRYEYEADEASLRGTFETEALPPDLAQIEFTATGQPTVPLVLVHLFHATGFKGYAIVDPTGHVVWYFRNEDYAFGMTRRANGNFVVLDRGRGLVEVTPAGEAVHQLAQDLALREMHHDVVATPWNTLLVIAFDARQINGTQVKGEAIWEWSPENGTIVKRWSSWDHLSITDDRGPRFGGEWMHANALAVGPRHNVLLSAHSFDQIISIAPGWQQIEWRLGGVNATIALPAGDAFSGQHTPREIAPGRVVLFDNRFGLGGYSRAVEFELEGTTAVKQWEWKATPPNYSAAISSARRLSNGNTLVGFGLGTSAGGSTGRTEVFEVTPTGEAVWHLLVGNTASMFRAEPMWTIGTEAEVVAGTP